MQDAITAYITAIVHTHQRGGATEHTYRPALKTLVETFDPAIIATNEPARQRCGAPDYVLTKQQRPLGYIETKTIGKDLDGKEYQEQFERYLAALSNLIITDYLHFQFWQNGNKIAEVSIGELKNNKIHPLKESFGQFETLLRHFCDFKGVTIRDADELAELLATKARVLSHAIQNALTDIDTDYANRSLQGHLEAFQHVLIPDIDIPTFSDVYAQTLAYGMFVARFHHKNGKIFSRTAAVESIPQSHPFLRKFFSYIASSELDDRIRWIIDELADVLQAADLKIIMENFGKQTQTEDPTIHFYEHFLAAYNPVLRKDIGAFYTPQSAVHYIIRAVDDILKEEFDLPDGLADRTKTTVKRQGAAESRQQRAAAGGEHYNSPPVEGVGGGFNNEILRRTKNFMALPYNPALKERAKALRKVGNLAEVLFWQQVKNKQFKKFDFDRQKIIGNYIVDFYCSTCNVVIEIDGDSHDNKQKYDATREEFLKNLGLTVIHIADIDVKKNLDAVMKMLYAHPALADIQTTPTPPKEGNDIDLHKVQILDPATGTGTFLAEIVRHIHANIVSQGQQGTWNRYVAEDLLPRLHGFEILMAPYAMAHLKLDMILEDTGYRFEKDQRVSIYLTNALDAGVNKIDRLPFALWLSDEAEGANRVKKDMPVMVVLGNPPYNNFRGVVSHFNETKYAKELIEQYKKGLGEKKTNIDNDYVKFIALGQNFIEKNPNSCGILAYISNNSFLDGITFRQMRKVLLDTFDKIYILNLHGDARKKETAPDGSKDENVFNIMQGTSINIFIKKTAENRKKNEKKPTTVFYADLYGKRHEKFEFLLKHRLKKTGFEQLDPVMPNYFFIPKDFRRQKKYEKGFLITELFPTSNSGVKTDRDSLFIDFDKDILTKRFKTFLSGNYDWRFEQQYRIIDSSRYPITKKIDGKTFDRQNIQPIIYRPFDSRWIYYYPPILSCPAHKVMQHIIGKDNIALITSRQFGGKKHFICFITNKIIEISSQPYAPYTVFPLYVYPPQEERRANFNQEIVTKIEQNIGKKVKPEKLFDYIYAILHSPKYRKDYEEFLKIDFPRIPYPTDSTEFERFAQWGKRLRELHLLEKVPKFKTTFPIADGNEVENVHYSPPVEGAGGGQVFINATQFFDNVPPEVWNFYIGGYQPAQKWLKDRKERTLTFDEIQHYQKIVAVLSETILIQQEMLQW